MLRACPGRGEGIGEAWCQPHVGELTLAVEVVETGAVLVIDRDSRTGAFREAISGRDEKRRSGEGDQCGAACNKTACVAVDQPGCPGARVDQVQAGSGQAVWERENAAAYDELVAEGRCTAVSAGDGEGGIRRVFWWRDRVRICLGVVEVDREDRPGRDYVGGWRGAGDGDECSLVEPGLAVRDRRDGRVHLTIGRGDNNRFLAVVVALTRIPEQEDQLASDCLR